MKVTLEFNLPEEKDQHTASIKGMDYFIALWDTSQMFRGLLKHMPEDSELDEVTLEAIQEMFFTILDDHNISLDEVS